MSDPRCEVRDEGTFRFVHDCLMHDGTTPHPDESRSLPLGADGWTWVGEPGLTIQPSIHCLRCGTHGFWRDGEWVPA